MKMKKLKNYNIIRGKGTVRIYFPFEEKGTEIFLSNENGRIYASKNGSGTKRTIQSVKTSRNSVTNYVNLLHLVDDEIKAITVYGDGNGNYELIPIEPEQVSVRNNRCTGYVTKQRYVQIEKKYIDQITNLGKKTLITSLFFDKKCYIELSGTKYPKLYPELKDVNSSFRKDIVEQTKVSFLTKTVNNNMYRLPVSFVKAGKIKPESILKCYITHDNRLIIEGPEVVCAATGSLINRYRDDMSWLTVGSESKRNLNKMRDYLSSAKGDTVHDMLQNALSSIPSEVALVKEATSTVTELLNAIKNM